MKKYDEYYYQKLDNVAIMYASISTAKNPNVYRISARLKENIDKDVLYQALENTLELVPSFNVRLKKGFFWYYFEKNNLKPKVSEDNRYPCNRVDAYSNNHYLFKTTYFEKRINLDVSHTLADGTGTISFLQTLIVNYLKIKNKISKEVITQVETLSKNEMSSDSFQRYCNYVDKKDDKKLNIGYKIRGVRLYESEINVVTGTLKVEDLKKIVKEHHTNITTLIMAKYIMSLYNENYKYRKVNKTIRICVPVNLRSFFESTSMNNFFIPVNIGIDFYKKDWEFSELLKEIDKQIKEQVEKENLAKRFKSMVGFEINPIARGIPLFLKNYAIRLGYFVGNSVVTSTVSNLGSINLLEEIRPYVDRFDVILGPDNSQPVKLAMCSTNDNLSITISSCITDTEIARNFFTNLGTKVNISSNQGEGI